MPFPAGNPALYPLKNLEKTPFSGRYRERGVFHRTNLLIHQGTKTARGPEVFIFNASENPQAVFKTVRNLWKTCG